MHAASARGGRKARIALSIFGYATVFALAASGALLQGMLRNPLADPFVTGTSAGASLGAVVF